MHLLADKATPLARTQNSANVAQQVVPRPVQSSRKQLHSVQLRIARASSSENPEVSMEELFAAELANRQAAELKQAEVAAAAVFDGSALLALLR